jgi:hypothetical protein
MNKTSFREWGFIWAADWLGMNCAMSRKKKRTEFGAAGLDRGVLFKDGKERRRAEARGFYQSFAQP